MAKPLYRAHGFGASNRVTSDMGRVIHRLVQRSFRLSKHPRSAAEDCRRLRRRLTDG